MSNIRSGFAACALFAFAVLLSEAPDRAGAQSPTEDQMSGEIVVLPVLFHIAPNPVAQVDASDGWLAEQIERANQVYRPWRIQFRLFDAIPLDASHAHLVSRRDRHMLAEYLRRGVINVFVVESMQDVDDPSMMRRGVHWRYPLDERRHWTVLTSIGPPTTLAHELGHYFGLRMHTRVRGNIMSYEHGDEPWLSQYQARRVQAGARRFLRTLELRPFDRIEAHVREHGALPDWPPVRSSAAELDRAEARAERSARLLAFRRRRRRR